MSWPKLIISSELPGIEDRLQQVILSWLGTPYHLGQQRIQVAVDCVRFVCAVADAMEGIRTPIASLPGDRSLHDREGARAALRTIMRLYDARRVASSPLFPGDVVVCGPAGGGPGHAMIVGQDGLYHASGDGVERTEMRPTFPHTEFDAILRVRNRKERWAV